MYHKYTGEHSADSPFSHNTSVTDGQTTMDGWQPCQRRLHHVTVMQQKYKPPKNFLQMVEEQGKARAMDGEERQEAQLLLE